MRNDKDTSGGEAMLRLVVESTPSALLMVDAQGSITLANGQASELFGYTREELLSLPIDSLVPERYRSRHPGERAGFFARPSKRAMGAGRDLHALRKGGSEVPVEIGLTPIETPAGLQVLVALIDISERRRLERERTESEQRYVDLVEQSINGFVVRSPDGRLMLVNEAYCRMTGYTRKELLRLRAQDMVVDQSVLERVATLRPGESTRIETLMKCKGGTTREVEYVTQRLQDGSLQSVILDLSERTRIERARDESERRYVELVDQALEGILIRRPSGEFLFVNDALCKMLGYTRGELLRMNINDIVHPEDAETIAQVYRLQGGGSLRLEKRMRRKDGHVLDVQVSVRRLSSGDFQSTVRDVTEQVQAREALRSFPKQLLDAQETERRRIARELHDEVGQALTASQIRLRDLETHLRGTASANDAAEISQMVATLLQQVRQLSLDLRPSVLDDLGLAAAIRWFMRERMSQGRLQLEVDVSLALPRPPAQIETAVFRMFQSAMTNILRHAAAERVRVSLRLEAPWLILEIRDDGKGFDLDAARQGARQGGSLGLLGMEEWIHLSGGKFTIESAPGQGTTVCAWVPMPAVVEAGPGQVIGGG